MSILSELFARWMPRRLAGRGTAKLGRAWRRGGVEIQQEGAHVFKLREGKVVPLEIFASRDKALQSIVSDRISSAS